MKTIIIIFLLFISYNVYANEGDFWRDKDKEKQGWKVLYEDFSHIKYMSKDGQIWTRCHSCFKFIPIKNAHQLFINRTIEKIQCYVGDRKINYEEIYYCDGCFKPEWNK